MTELLWSDALSLDLPMADDTHRAFVASLRVVSECPKPPGMRILNGLA